MNESIPPEHPPLMRDRAFYGISVTQFLGAFNDNVFKQLVLLLCVIYLDQTGRDYQPLALALFAIPFVMFSGLGGWLADRNSKRTIVVLCKLAEIGVMLLGMAVLALPIVTDENRLWLLFVVLFLMSTQSAFFGPSKYGILPELFRDRDLPQVNGFIQMTTFVAIIFGVASVGYCKEWFGSEVWKLGSIAVAIGVAGTATSLLVRRTPIAQPGLPFSWSSLAINHQTWRMLMADRALLVVLLVSTLFWFVGGVVHPAVNEFGMLQLGLSAGRTSLMAACMGVGIAVGCIVSGKISRGRIDFRLVTWGAWGLVIHLLILGCIGTAFDVPADKLRAPTPLLQLLVPETASELLSRLAFLGLGISAGVFVVPLQVFLQSRPADDQKGRMIGAMNLVNWIGIVCSAVFLVLVKTLLHAWDLRVSWVFPGIAVLLLPVALGFDRWFQKYESRSLGVG
ncbi:MAG: MFS transporter [Planctomycetaceae bacterium]